MYLREIHAHINPASVREQTYSISITSHEVSQYQRIVSVLSILCPTIVSTTRETSSKHKLHFDISWKGQFIVPNQFCDSNHNPCYKNKTEPFVVRLRGKMSDWQTVEVPEVTPLQKTVPSNTMWVGRLRTSSGGEKPIVMECDLVRENNELKKRIKELEDKLLQIFAD
jgi:hypothetical protein